MNKNNVHDDSVVETTKTFLQQVKECLEEWWNNSHWNYNKTHESERHLKYQFGFTPIYMLGILEHPSGGISMYTENDIRKVILQIKDGRAFPSPYTNNHFTNNWAIDAAYMLNTKLFHRIQGKVVTDEEIDKLEEIAEKFKTDLMKQNFESSNKILAISDNVVSINPAPENIPIEIIKMKVIPAVNQVHFNKIKGYTTVLFNDGTRTTTKGPAGNDFDPEIGYAMCIMKKMHGNRTQFKKMINEYMDKSEFRNTKIQQKVDRKKKTDENNILERNDFNEDHKRDVVTE